MRISIGSRCSGSDHMYICSPICAKRAKGDDPIAIPIVNGYSIVH